MQVRIGRALQRRLCLMGTSSRAGQTPNVGAHGLSKIARIICDEGVLVDESDKVVPLPQVLQALRKPSRNGQRRS